MDSSGVPPPWDIISRGFPAIEGSAETLKVVICS